MGSDSGVWHEAQAHVRSGVHWFEKPEQQLLYWYHHAGHFQHPWISESVSCSRRPLQWPQLCKDFCLNQTYNAGLCVGENWYFKGVSVRLFIALFMIAVSEIEITCVLDIRQQQNTLPFINSGVPTGGNAKFFRSLSACVTDLFASWAIHNLEGKASNPALPAWNGSGGEMEGPCCTWEGCVFFPCGKGAGLLTGVLEAALAILLVRMRGPLCWAVPRGREDRI